MRFLWLLAGRGQQCDANAAVPARRGCQGMSLAFSLPLGLTLVLCALRTTTKGLTIFTRMRSICWRTRCARVFLVRSERACSVVAAWAPQQIGCDSGKSACPFALRLSCRVAGVAHAVHGPESVCFVRSLVLVPGNRRIRNSGLFVQSLSLPLTCCLADHQGSVEPAAPFRSNGPC